MTRDSKLSLRNLKREPTSIYDLSDDNLSEIFFRLPVRVLLCCQCVCKRFSKVITDPKFRKIHVNRAMASNTTSFCLVHLIVSDLSDICGSVENFKHRYDHILLEKTQFSASFSYLRLSNPLISDISIVGSSNGLVCAQLKSLGDQSESNMLIWNPVTRENRFVAEPKRHSRPTKQKRWFKTFHALAFGFTPGTNDYKVVRITSCKEPGEARDIKLEIFNMSTDKWSAYQIKTLQCRETDHMPPQVDPSILLNMIRSHNTPCLKGAFHWLCDSSLGARGNDTAILSFGLEEEQLRLFTVLDSNKIPHLKSGKLDCMNESLSVIVPYYSSNCPIIDIWVMNDYGDRNSWIKMYSVDQFQGLGMEPIGYWKDDLFLMANLAMKDGYLCLYNLRNQEMKPFPVQWHFYTAAFYDYVETFETVRRAIATTAEAV
ncbi:F-box/kelch-repeat protein At3g06240-like [Daucus carota subsp. sativus]|uniref:F-box/kelch-repeat protein At3g06240-like n=1 Tax=Daucus carota subsp. sativus TaxID=79200 RepID=UPI003083D136